MLPWALIDDQRRWIDHVVLRGDHLVGIIDAGIRHLVTAFVGGAVGARILLVHAEEDHAFRHPLRRQLVEVRLLRVARTAPRAPEVEHDDVSVRRRPRRTAEPVSVGALIGVAGPTGPLPALGTEPRSCCRPHPASISAAAIPVASIVALHGVTARSSSTSRARFWSPSTTTRERAAGSSARPQARTVSVGRSSRSVDAGDSGIVAPDRAPLAVERDRTQRATRAGHVEDDRLSRAAGAIRSWSSYAGAHQHPLAAVRRRDAVEPAGLAERATDVLLVGPEIEHADGEQRTDLRLAEEAAPHLVELRIRRARRGGPAVPRSPSRYSARRSRSGTSRRASTPISMNAPGWLRM